MGKGIAEYEPLATSPNDEETAVIRQDSIVGGHRGSMLHQRSLVVVIIVETLLLLGSFGIILKGLSNPTAACQYKPLTYSPADEAIQYQVKAFTAGRTGSWTPYQGLSDEVDDAWQDLYQGTIIKIPRHQAERLPNKTYPIYGNPGYYIVEIDVFHQLHCLNAIRQALHREYYTNGTHLDEDHISHCVDAIRQSLMCSADTSTNVWQWSDEFQAVAGYSTQAHTCRNFTRIRDWARERSLEEFIPVHTYIEDDLPDPPILY